MGRETMIFIMNIFALPLEVWITLIVIIAATGIFAALHSWVRITTGQKEIKDAESKLISDDAWNEAYPHDKLKLAIWLRQNGIKPDSHLGDIIRTCWSAWLGGRPASLTELHVLVARRERSHKATRLSAGIAALLLVCGIVGTLSAIKPVLGDFRFDPVGIEASDSTSEGYNTDLDSVDTDASTARVNQLIHDLGDAFWPSLAALLGTIIVVSFRGLYSLSLHKFTLDLDRFAVDMLIPRYRVPSLSEQYQEVKATLSSITENLIQREERFHQVVQQLESIVVGITPGLSCLDIAAQRARETAEALAGGAESITESLNRNLGAKSPIYKAVQGLDSVFEKTEQSLTTFASVVKAIGESNTASRHGLESAIQSLAQSVGQIAADHQMHQAEAEDALREFKGSLSGIPATIEATSKETVDAGIASIKLSVSQLNDEQKKWHTASSAELKSATVDGLTEVSKAGQNLATQAERIASAAANLGETKTEARALFKDLADTSGIQITEIGNATKSKIDSAANGLVDEVMKIQKIVDELSKNRTDLATSKDLLPDYPIADPVIGSQQIQENTKQLPENRATTSIYSNSDEHGPISDTAQKGYESPFPNNDSDELKQATDQIDKLREDFSELSSRIQSDGESHIPIEVAPDTTQSNRERKWWQVFPSSKH